MVSSLAPFDLPGILTGVAPGNVQFLRLSHQKPWVVPLALLATQPVGQVRSEAIPEACSATFDAADRTVFTQPEVHGAIFATSGTSHGQQVDTALIIGEWDFNLKEIAVPVQLWQGDQDHNASLAMYHYLTDTIPHGPTPPDYW